MNGEVKCIQNEIPFEIPESWVWCRLNCICEIKGGKRIPKGLSFTKNATEHIYIRITDMKNETICDNDLVYISNKVYNKISNYIISKDDLYVTIAGTIGRCGEVPDKFNNMNLTENAVKLTRIQIDKSYLKNIINSEFIFNNLNFKAHQVAQPKLSIITLSNVLVPIAPYKEQIEISVKIQNIRKSILKLLNKLSVVSNMKQQLKSKVLDSIFSDNSSYKSYYENEFNLGDILEYEQPGPYIVKNTNYNDSFNIPVLTPGKTFILGYTDEKDGIYKASKDNKVIIFDDFTTASKLVDFDFKVKSSAMKILHISDKSKFDIEYMYYLLQTINIIVDTHKRFWISEYAPLKVKIHTFEEQVKIKNKIKNVFEIIDNL